jgi:hypothetical protein
MSQPELSLAPGSIIAGRFRVEASIGSGGHGHVVRAAELASGRSVALKVLRPELVDSAEERGRFRREARVAQQLEHPNIVRLYEVGETPDGVCFMAFELLAGEPLSALIAREAPLPAARTARIASQVLKSLMAAHERGVIHRDVKPPNVFLCRYAGEQDFVKVLDFGVAKPLVASGATEAGLTCEGELIGTPSYMAPEQVAGLAVGPSTDLYALGLVMAECLSGRVVYPATDLRQVVLSQLSPQPAPLEPSVLGSPLGPVIRRAVEKLPPARYPSAAEMLAAVELALGTAAPAAISAEPAAKAPSRAQAEALGVADTLLARDAFAPLAVPASGPGCPQGSSPSATVPQAAGSFPGSMGTFATGAPPAVAGSWPGSLGPAAGASVPIPLGSWPGSPGGAPSAQSSGPSPAAAPTLMSPQRPSSVGASGTVRVLIVVALVLALFGTVVAVTLGFRSVTGHRRASEAAPAGESGEATSGPRLEPTSGPGPHARPRPGGGPWALDAEAITERMDRLGWKPVAPATARSEAAFRYVSIVFQRGVQTAVVFVTSFITPEDAEAAVKGYRAQGYACDRRGKIVAGVRYYGEATDPPEGQRIFAALFQ